MLYKSAVVLLAAILFCRALSLWDLDSRYFPELAAFFVLILASECLPIRMSFSNDDFTMTIPAIMSLLISHGPYPATVVGTICIALGILVSCRCKGLKLLDIAVYSASMCVLCVTAASFVYRISGGNYLSHDPSVLLSSIIIPIVAATLTISFLNVVMCSTFSALTVRAEPWRVLFLQTSKWAIPTYVVTPPSAVLFAYLYQQFGIYGILLIIIPSLMGRQALNVYSRELAAYRETITTLGAYMQRYHPYTRGHLERVADLSDKMARHMGLSTSTLMLMRDAGLLHDIGKVGVDEEILDSTQKLTDEEWAIIKQHPATGAEILAQMDHLERIVPWIRSHHERPDGTGYPDGLTLEEIPTEAAVIAVADAFDAMTGNDEEDTRVYRKPLTLDQAIAQIRYGAGTQFHPTVVKAFMQVMARQEMENGQ